MGDVSDRIWGIDDLWPDHRADSGSAVGRELERVGLGMLGLAIKGGLWIAFAGAFFGMGLCAKPYRTLEVIAILLVLVACFYVGIWLFNRPFDPANHRLPYLYFSDDWRWEPEGNLKPRSESGRLCLRVCSSGSILDLAQRSTGSPLRLVGTLGRCPGLSARAVSSSHTCLECGCHSSESLERLGSPYQLVELDGNDVRFVMGFILAYGVRRWTRCEQRNAIEQDSKASINLGSERVQGVGASLDDTPVRHAIAMGLLSLHVLLLLDAEFAIFAAWYPWLPWLKDVQRFYDHGLILAFLPIVAVSISRWASLFVLLPLVAIPLSVKRSGNL